MVMEEFGAILSMNREVLFDATLPRDRTRVLALLIAERGRLDGVIKESPT